MNSAAEFDIILYGASGFTGRLVAEYMAEGYGDGSVKWAMAGRDAQKLAALRDEIGMRRGTPILIADAGDGASLKQMVQRAKAVVTTVGPYQVHGSALVAACADTGTDYLDLCGEPAWMRAMIDAHEATARRTGARILFSCGFDSIPFELGVWFLQEQARMRFGAPVPRVKGCVRGMRGTFSGGTIASLKATIASARNPVVMELLKNPFALTPGFSGPIQPHGVAVAYDDDLDAWTAPFVMAGINTRNIHRSNFLMGHPYGTDFVYSEMVVAGPGERGEATAKAIVAANAALGSREGPRSGEGPSREERDAGYYDVLFLGIAADGRQIRASVIGDKDPGYGSTSRIVAEAAVCLVKEGAQVPGGIWTPGAAMRQQLLTRLEKNAGLKFGVEGQ
jgi:short subunit dehydrogenase-like uncharacterized protein